MFIHPHACKDPDPGYPVAMAGERRVFRAYTADGRIRGGVVLDEFTSQQQGSAEAALDHLFADGEAAVVHMRAVEFGCFDFEVRRPAEVPLP